LHNGLLLWERPAWSGVFALLVYGVFASANGSPWALSPFPYYNALADAFLHGQLHLRLLPDQTHDLVYFGGRYYLYWPPFPALVLVPLVAVFGAGFSDVLFTLVLGGLNVALVALVLRQADREKVVSLTKTQRALLVLFFAFGTVHLTLAPYGRVWYTGQILGFACLALAYLAALSLRGGLAFLLTGLALAAAALTRNHLVFAGLWPVYYLLRRHRPVGGQRLAVLAAAGLAPLAVAGGLFAGYNWLRFGDPLEVGLDDHRMAQVFVADYQRYGPFSLHYLPENLRYQYLEYPFPLSAESYQGGSLILLSPVFLAAFWSIAIKGSRASDLALWASVVLVNIPILLLMGTGWVQFGPRYSLDFCLPLLLLAARGLPRWPVGTLALLVALSILHYVLGAAYLLQAMG
jgi:hypothetical protein